MKIYVTIPKDRVEVLDFKLTPVHIEPKGHETTGPLATQDPSVEEFQRFIKDLSLGVGLEELVRSTATQNSFRYRSYKEMAEFLRGLTLNFPKITYLRRYTLTLKQFCVSLREFLKATFKCKRATGGE